MDGGTGARAARRRAPLSLKARALALLAQREHSVVELRRKLLRHARAEDGATDDAARVDALIEWLRAQRYLSEERFVESRVHARSARYGNLRIRHELAQHGLALTPQAARALEESELQRATEVWRRKFGRAPANAAERARHAGFLVRRGFSADVVGRLMRQVARGSGAVADED